jgi:hypothetical protein
MSSLLTSEADAAGIQATVTTRTLNEVGTGSNGIALFLNGAPLAISEGQMVSLGVGDVLRAELSATAMTEVGTSSYDKTVFFNILLDDDTLTASLTSVLSGTANSTTAVAQGSTGGEVVCDFTTTGCSAPGLPLSTAFNSGALSSTLSIQPNAMTINNVTTDTGRIGGVETIDLPTNLVVDRQLGSPTARVSASAVALAISEASASANTVLELLVTDATLVPVPVPAAAWLFGSALGLLGWVKRRAA